jgi:hypothetical protein
MIAAAWWSYDAQRPTHAQPVALSQPALLAQMLANDRADQAAAASKFRSKGVKMLMTKVRIEDLPATVTAGLDETVEDNPHCDIDFGAGGAQWIVTKIFPDTAAIANETSPNGWSVAPGGVIGIPDGIEYGKYQIIYGSPSPDGVCDDNENFGYVYHYIVKIVPPCPTSVTLTHSP